MYWIPTHQEMKKKNVIEAQISNIEDTEKSLMDNTYSIKSKEKCIYRITK